MSSSSTDDEILLKIVRRGGGRYSYREIDMRYSSLVKQGEENVFSALQRLEAAGYVKGHREGANDRWELTPAGSRMIE
jgi:DNA-binding PadR family transcriptional regulator